MHFLAQKPHAPRHLRLRQIVQDERPIEAVSAQQSDVMVVIKHACPGRFMSRVAPGFIQNQLTKGSKGIIPKTAH